MNRKNIKEILYKVPKDILIKCYLQIILNKVPKDTLIKCYLQFIFNKVSKNKLIECYEKKKNISNNLQIKKSNSNPIKTNKIIKPYKKMSNVMLANSYDPEKHEKKVEGWWISIKYDGVRGKWNGNEMESRTGLIYTLPRFIQEQLEKIIDENDEPLQLDGEIWFGNNTFDLASGAARRVINDDNEWKQMIYMVFDIPDETLPFEERIDKLQKAIKNAGNVPNIQAVSFKKFNPKETTIDEELKKVEDSGGEGLMLRKPGSMYQYTRSNDMLKVKSWFYKEAIVIGYEEGKNKYQGMVGSLIVETNQINEDGEENPDEKIQFSVGSGLNDWQRYSGNPMGDWSSKEVQQFINKERLKKVQNFNSKEYSNLIEKVKNSTGRDKYKTMHLLSEMYRQMPVIGDIITFKFKEFNKPIKSKKKGMPDKPGLPKQPTFVGVRNYE